MEIYYFNILLLAVSFYILYKINQDFTKRIIKGYDRERVMKWQKELFKKGAMISAGKGNIKDLVVLAGENYEIYKDLIRMMVSFILPVFIIFTPLEIIMRGNPLAKIGGFEVTWQIPFLLLIVVIIVYKVMRKTREKRKNQ